MLVIRPWGSADEGTANEVKIAIAPASPSAPPRAGSSPWRVGETDIERALGRLAEAPRRDDVVEWTAIGGPTRAGSAQLSDELPSPAELGGGCTGGALLGMGSSGLALALPPGGAESFAVRRLFEDRPPVRLAARHSRHDGAAVTVLAPAGAGWAPGFYVLTFSADAGQRVLPFCVGELTRAVDYSLIVYVPLAAGTSSLLRPPANETEP